MPEDLLECNSGEMLNQWLSLFVKERRRVVGKDVDQRCHGIEGQSLQLAVSTSVSFISFVTFCFITGSAAIA